MLRLLLKCLLLLLSAIGIGCKREYGGANPSETSPGNRNTNRDEELLRTEFLNRLREDEALVRKQMQELEQLKNEDRKLDEQRRLEFDKLKQELKAIDGMIKDALGVPANPATPESPAQKTPKKE